MSTIPNYTNDINDLKEKVNEKFDDLNIVADQLTNLFDKYAIKKNEMNDYNNKKIPELISKNAVEYANLKDEIDMLTLKYNHYSDELNKLNQQLQDIINADNNEVILNSYVKTRIDATESNLHTIKEKIMKETLKHYPLIKDENSRLKSNLDKNHNDESLKTVKQEYKIRSTQYLESMNNILFFTYYVLVFIFVYILSGKVMLLKMKLLLISVLLLFPFFIYSFQDNLNTLYHKFYKFLFVN